MATVQITGSPASFSLTSTWICNASGVITSGPTTATKTVSFAVSLPTGSIITSAYVHSEWGSPKGGFAIRQCNGTTVPTDTGNVSVSVGTTNGTVSFEFKFKSNGISGQAGGQASGITNVSNVYLMIDYTIPYTACTAPTSVSVSATNVTPGKSVTLSWSGAGAGTSNAITGYHVYRATSASGTYSKLSEVSTTATSGSTTVTAPTANGSSYYYKIYTIGTVSGYNSSISSAYATLTCSFSAPNAPTSVTINGSSSVSMSGNETATLAWSGGSAGTNNPMTGYKIYIDGALYSSVGTDVSSLSITAFSAGNHTLTVRTAGTYSDSADSTAVYCIVSSDIIAPNSCLLDGTLGHGPVALYWSGAIDGENNAIIGYEVQRCESTDGKTWGDWETISTQTQATLSVSPPETYGNYYWYRVKACGAICDSDWKNCTHTLRRDHQPFEAYTDASLVVGETYVKAVHMTELQSNIGMLLDFYHLDEQSMTDIIAGETGLAGWTEHVEEVRSAIDFLTTYHDDWLAIPVNRPRADVLQQLRNVISDVEKPKCVLGICKLGAMVTE